MNNYKHIVKNFLIYSSGGLILRIITGLSTILTIKVLSPNSFGLLSLINNVSVILPLITGMGLRQFLGLKYYSLDSKQKNILISKIISLYLLISIPTSIALIAAHNQINKFIFLNKANLFYIAAIVAIAFLSFFTELLFQIMRFEEKAGRLTLIQISMSLMLATSNIILVYIWLMGIKGILISQIVSHMISVTYLAIYLYKQFKIILFKKKEAYSAIKIGIVFAMQSLIIWIAPLQNKWILAKLTYLGSLGIFSVAYSIANMYQLLALQIANNLYIPYIFKQFKTNPQNGIKLNSQLTKAITATLILTVGTFYLISKCGILQQILPTSYERSIPLITPLLIGNTIFIYGYLLSSKIQYFYSNKLSTLYTSHAILNLFASYLLTKLWGIHGTTISIIFANLIFCGLSIFYSYYTPSHK